jgi:hypothetical protein
MATVATVVVVQSDSLAAWVGVVGGLSGVVLGAGIDSYRRWRADRAQRRRDVLKLGDSICTSAVQALTAARAVFTAIAAQQDSTGPKAKLDARSDDVDRDAVALTLAGTEDTVQVIQQLRQVAMRAAETLPGPATDAWNTDLATALANYQAAVRKAKL